MTKKIIWVIDDDAIYQIIVRKIIERSELFPAPSIFKNGNEGLMALKDALEYNKTLPDIIFLDVNMPIMDGWEFMEEMILLKPRINKKIEIYVVSSSISVEDREKAKKYSDILGYLSKPITSSDLQIIASTI